ncbi:isoprenylcysteine carboxylmethyltransferase family protein [Candidatus Nomurabacteria bacterium]|nr:isoprenylcysteine carboxylmethyltransferase family protein [Candidatus Nomurabacteria bacterium]
MTFRHLSSLTQLISYSPLIFLVGIIIGIVLNIFFPLEFTHHTLRAIALGWFLLLVAPVLLFWGNESRATCYYHDEEDHVCKMLGAGPYTFTRHPKYVSFLFLVVGLGLILNSIIMFIVALVLFLVFTFLIIPKEEEILMGHFANYAEYRKEVPMWL